MKKIIISLLFFSFFYYTNAQLPDISKKYSLEFANLKCNKTTEMGEDEVYFLFSMVKRSVWEGLNGDYKSKILEKASARLPGENQHWDMNDGSSSNTVLNGFTLYNFSLDPGESAEFVVAIMEEDGGIASNVLDTISAALVASGDSYAVAVGVATGVISKVMRFLGLGTDTDDYIGSILIKVGRHLVEEEGQPSYEVSYTPIDRVFAIGDDVSAKAINFRGDGSDYTAWFRVKENQ